MTNDWQFPKITSEGQKKSLEAAKILLDKELFEDSISRSYYAIYHSIFAMLYSIGLSTKTHKEQMHLFYNEFIVTKKVPEHLNRKINQILNARSDADYGSIPVLQKEDAIHALETANEVMKIANAWVGANTG